MAGSSGTRTLECTGGESRCPKEHVGGRRSIRAARAAGLCGRRRARAVAGAQRHHRGHHHRRVGRRAARRHRHRPPTSTPAPSASVVTNEKGLYRAPLLPLGTYQVRRSCRASRSSSRPASTPSVGQTAVVNVALEVGGVSEMIIVTGRRAGARPRQASTSATTMNDREVHNLPLVARNPYNFALVQPGVTGIENVEFGVPRLAANGAAMRINYQIDGNTNTEKDRAGLRLLPMSEVMIQKSRSSTTGFAPEFGQTMGMVYNAVTPSGTNTFRGEGSYLFRRKPFSAFPFFSDDHARARPARTSRPTSSNTGDRHSVGGPVVKNKVFFYAGWEQTRSRPVRRPSTWIRRWSRRSAWRRSRPRADVQTAAFFIGKGDYQLEQGHRADRARGTGSTTTRRTTAARRHDDARARHRLPRRDGLDRRPAGLDLGIEQAERVPLPVRAPPLQSSVASDGPDGHLGHASPTPSRSAIRPVGRRGLHAEHHAR